MKLSQNLYSREYPYLYRGIVESNEDPQKLGRCRVRVTSVHGNSDTSLIQWARPIVTSTVSSNRGSVNIPDEGDIVWVFFEGGNKRFPVYLGGTYSKRDIAVNKNMVDLLIEGNARISCSKNGNNLILSVGNNKINISNSGISISGDTDIQGNLRVSGNISVGGSLEVSGNTVLNNLQINGSCNLQCKCGEVNTIDN